MVEVDKREGANPLGEASMKISDSLIHLVMDYGPGDLATSEVLDAISSCVPDKFRLHVTSVPSFNTVATAFVVAQLGLKPRTESWEGERIVYANCAPRKDRGSARTNNEGEGLLYGVLDNGTKVVAVNSGYSMSLLRDHLIELHETKIRKDGSQFRSRDNFPPLVGAVACHADLKEYLGRKLDPKKVIPEILSGVVGYIDSFGNIKTTFRASDSDLASLQPGAKVKIRVAGAMQARTATLVTGSFNIEEGELALSPGSSGYDNRFWELFQRGGSAAKEFDMPVIGAEIKITPIKRD